MKSILKSFAVAVSMLALSMSASAQKYVVSQDKMLDRLLSYVKIDSQSDYNLPITKGQEKMAQFLAAEAASLGAKVYVCPDSYVYVELPSNVKFDLPTLGISCHYDVSPEAVGGKVKPIVTKYQGGVVVQSKGRVISPDAIIGQDLKNHIGKTLIHTDGSTLLGGDDKNGCAITMSVLESLIKGGDKVEHGKVQFVFCPNEDVGRSAEKIDIKHFNPDILFDMDGEGGQDVTVSNFTAYGYNVRFTGTLAHPGEAKKMKFGDAMAAAATFVASVPVEYRPENSEGRQGYIHPFQMEKVEAKRNAQNNTADDSVVYEVSTRIRYFDKADGEKFKSIMNAAVAQIKRDFPNVKTEVIYDDVQYENVEYTMHPKSKDIIAVAAAKCGVKLNFVDGRGGSTASMFCTRGLKGGMNVFTGQYVTHSTNEYSVLEDMYDAYRLMMEVVNQVVLQNK
ncbi:MAG: tripeptide aminopeptidase PepT [Alistipes sp.]|nr:tripeptide aminopeptidase PepT [Alistipes sp.]